MPDDRRAEAASAVATPRAEDAIPFNVVTGASDGLGRAVAERLSARGETVLGLGRRARLEGIRFDYRSLDLAQPEAGDRFVKILGEAGRTRIGRLIHVAGIGWAGPVEDQPPDSIDAVLGVDFLAPTLLTRAAAPLLEGAGGRVVFVGSAARYLPSPDFAVYAAAKAALDGFARSLRLEWRDRIEVQTIHPSGVATGMHERIGFDTGPARRRFLSVDAAAARTVAALDGPDGVRTLGPAAWLARRVGRSAALERTMARRRGTLR